MRSRVGGGSWVEGQFGCEIGRPGGGTDQDAEVDGAAEGVVALDESVQGPACQRDPGQVFGVDVAEYVVEQLRREVCQGSHCTG